MGIVSMQLGHWTIKIKLECVSEMKLYTYQEELVNSKSDRIMINWCRGAGKTTAIVEYILINEPASVLMDNETFRGVVQHLEHSSMDRWVEITISLDYIKISLTGVGRTIHIQRCPISRDVSSKDYDLYIFENDTVFGEKNLGFKKVIKVATNNIYSSTYTYNKNIYDTSVVDYEDAVKENALTTDEVVRAALGNTKNSFYKQYAIKDKPKKDVMDFDMFRFHAIQRLQKQFLETSDSKDTVLTRKNIIEMIKDLRTIN